MLRSQFEAKFRRVCKRAGAPVQQSMREFYDSLWTIRMTQQKGQFTSFAMVIRSSTIHPDYIESIVKMMGNDGKKEVKFRGPNHCN